MPTAAISEKMESDKHALSAAPESSGEGESVLAFPASVAQQMFWYLELLQGEVAAFNVPLRFRLTGPLDVGLLERSLNTIIERHEALRTRLGEEDGELLQIVMPELRVRIPVIDISHLPEERIHHEADRLGSIEAQRSFQLSTGPLIRAELIRLSGDSHIFHVSVHHAVFDGLSMTVLTGELAKIYQAYFDGDPCPLEPLAIQFGDYSVWQKDFLDGPEMKQQLAYWKQKLEGMTELELPTDFPRPPVKSWNGDITSILLEKELTDKLHALAARHGCTLFHLQLAAFMVLLQRYTGSDDIALGTPVSGRTRGELEPIIGVFINSLILRCDLSGNPGFGKLLGKVRETALEAMENQDLPFEYLVRELRAARDPGRNPLFQVNFNHHRSFAQAGTFGGVSLAPMPSRSPGTIFDLHFFMVERKEGWRASCDYSTDLFTRTSANRMLGHFKRLLEDIAARPDAPIGELEVLTDSEKSRLEDWSRSEDKQNNGTKVHILDASLRKLPVGIPGELWSTVAANSDHSGEVVEHPELGRIQCTGDICRFDEEGTIHFVKSGSSPATSNVVVAPAQSTTVADPASAEERLTVIWEDLLGISGIGRDDDFFELGGHSLMSLRMFSRIRRDFGKTLPLGLLIKHPTIAGLASLLTPVEAISEPIAAPLHDEEQVAKPVARPLPSSRSVDGGHVVTLSKGGTERPLFCIHGGDGGVVFYRGLAELLPAQLPLHAIESLELGKSGKIRQSSVEETAAAYLTTMLQVQPSGPFRIAGYSFGGVVAHEMACQLLEQGHEVEFLGLFDTQNPSAEAHSYSPFQRFNVFMKDNADVPFFKRMGQLRSRIIEGTRTHRRIRAELEAARTSGPAEAYSDLRRVQVREENWRAMQAYCPRPFKGRITLYKTTHLNDKVQYAPDYGWSQVALSGLDIVSVSGHHLALFAPENIGPLAHSIGKSLCAPPR